MNSKKLIEQKDFKIFPYNYRLIDVIKIDKQIVEKKTVEIEKTQSNNHQQFFYKPISRVQ